MEKNSEIVLLLDSINYKLLLLKLVKLCGEEAVLLCVIFSFS